MIMAVSFHLLGKEEFFLGNSKKSLEYFTTSLQILSSYFSNNYALLQKFQSEIEDLFPVNYIK